MVRPCFLISMKRSLHFSPQITLDENSKGSKRRKERKEPQEQLKSAGNPKIIIAGKELHPLFPYYLAVIKAKGLIKLCFSSGISSLLSLIG